MWCRVGGVGARSRKREGLGYRLVRKHAWTEMLDLLISMFLGLGYVRIHSTQRGRRTSKLSYVHCTTILTSLIQIKEVNLSG